MHRRVDGGDFIVALYQLGYQANWELVILSSYFMITAEILVLTG